MMENKTKIDLKNKSIFITGVAGFIGSNLAKRLLSTVEGVKVVGLDNMNNYYDVRLKEARLKELERFENFSFVKGNLADKAVIKSIFEQYKPEIVVNLGAQAGVRYSITNPDAYVEANLIGFYNILEACRHSYDDGHTPVEHLVYASSSSVYSRMPGSICPGAVSGRRMLWCWGAVLTSGSTNRVSTAGSRRGSTSGIPTESRRPFGSMTGRSPTRTIRP